MPLVPSKQPQKPVMAPLPKWRPRRTLIDLYTERDHTRWYWRLAAIMAAAMIMLGFLIFPASFPDNSTQGVDKRGSGIIAGILLLLGYSISIGLRFTCKSWLFHLDVIYNPCLFSSVLGFFNVTYMTGIHSGSKPRWSGSAIAGLLVAIVSSVTYLVFSLLTFRKVHMVRARDAMHRRHSDGESIHLLPEDEMQRQQLLRLLLQRENGVRPSPEASQSTFRIDLPDSIRRAETHLTAPQNIYESRDGRSRSVPPVGSYPNISGPRSTNIPPEAPQIPLDPALDRNFSQSSRSPPYTAGDLGIPNIINTRYPDEKEQETTHLEGEVHPLERDVLRARPQYQIVDTLGGDFRIDDKQGLKGGFDENRPQSASRESRRAEIELERSKKGDAKRAELEGVKISPRIQRVETDGWSRR